MFKSIFLPWLVIADLRDQLEQERARTTYWMEAARGATSAAAKFDHDGDGRPGGSRKKAETA